MLTLDFLGVLLAHWVLLGIEMPLVCAPPVGVKCRDAKRFQKGFELEKNVVLTPSNHIRQHSPRAVVNGVPKPAWIGFAANVGPQFIEL